MFQMPLNDKKKLSFTVNEKYSSKCKQNCIWITKKRFYKFLKPSS